MEDHFDHAFELETKLEGKEDKKDKKDILASVKACSNFGNIYFLRQKETGGLSSSAAVTLVFLVALCKVNDFHLSKEVLIQILVWSENNYVGVSSGTLDQSCECYCKAN